MKPGLAIQHTCRERSDRHLELLRRSCSSMEIDSPSASQMTIYSLHRNRSGRSWIQLQCHEAHATGGANLTRDARYSRAATGARHLGLPTNKRSIAAISTELMLASGSLEQSHWTILCFGRSITRHAPAALLLWALPWDSLTLTVVEGAACTGDSAAAAPSITSMLNNTRTLAALLANGETR